LPCGRVSGRLFIVTGHAPEALELPLGLPDLPFHLRLDMLSSFFLLLLGLAGVGISTFAAGYFREGEGTSPALICLEYHIFLAMMATVMLANDAYLFMVAWETMALSSYFLVTSRHALAGIRRADCCTLSWLTWAPSASCLALVSCRVATGSFHLTPCAETH